MPETDQRTAAYTVLGVAAASAIATGVLFGLAGWQDGVATGVRDDQAEGTITEDQRLEHNDALATRDDLVLAGSITAAATGAIGITGLLLYLIDTPEVAPPSRGADQPSPNEPSEEAPVDVMAAAGPSGGTVRLRLRF